MQTPKGSRTSLEVPQRVSPRISPQAARQLKTTASESESVSASSQASRTPRERSPKVAERRSPRSPASSEKKRPSRISELESQILQLQGELKKAKDELISSEAWKKQAEQDAEESVKQISELSTKLEEAQEQILHVSSSEESRACEIERITQEKEQAWRAELEAVKKQHSLDSSALASSVNEILRLKNELETVAESEAAQKEQAQSVGAELQSLKGNLAETQRLIENMETELKDSRESEAHARALVNDTLIQLESAKATVEALHLEGIKASESYKSIASELDQSRARVNTLEGIVRKLEADLANADGVITSAPRDVEGIENETRIQNAHETNKLKEEVESLKLEVEKLRSALIAAEAKNNDGDNGGEERLKDADEMMEKMKIESAWREAELVAEINKAKATMEDLKAHLMDKETELQGIREENECLNLKLEKNTSMLEKESAAEKDIEKLREELSELKANMMDKETELQHISEENETMKSVIKKRDEIVAELESARNTEKEALVKLNLVMEEVEKSNRRAARVTEQLEASQASAAEMESELRRLKVQSDQWRKAAEAAAAMISVGGNGKYMDRTASLEGGYVTGKMGSPYADDTDDDDLMKKKNGNVLKKIGVLWKKPQK